MGSKKIAYLDADEARCRCGPPLRVWDRGSHRHFSKPYGCAADRAESVHPLFTDGAGFEVIVHAHLSARAAPSSEGEAVWRKAERPLVQALVCARTRRMGAAS